MSIPVIALNDDQQKLARELRERMSSLTTEIKRLDEEKRGAEQSLHAMLHSVAMGSDDYRKSWEGHRTRNDGRPYDHRYDYDFPYNAALSEDGTAMVIIRKQFHR